MVGFDGGLYGAGNGSNLNVGKSGDNDKIVGNIGDIRKLQNPYHIIKMLSKTISSDCLSALTMSNVNRAKIVLV